MGSRLAITQEMKQLYRPPCSVSSLLFTQCALIVLSMLATIPPSNPTPTTITGGAGNNASNREQMLVRGSYDGTTQTTLYECFTVQHESKMISYRSCLNAIQECSKGANEAVNKLIQPSNQRLLLSNIDPISAREEMSEQRNRLMEIPHPPFNTSISLRLPMYALLDAVHYTSSAINVSLSKIESPSSTIQLMLCNGIDQVKVDNFYEDDLLFVSSTASRIFRATTDSSLSESGGLHRSLQTAVSVHLSMSSQPTTCDYSSAISRIELLLLVYLPSDVFVNVNDAFEYSNEFNLELITFPGTVIDEEQPAFASPPHAVYVRLRGTVNLLPLSKSHTISFAMKIHLRYPRLIPAGVDAFFSRIVMKTPTMIGGTLQSLHCSADQYSWSPLDSLSFMGADLEHSPFMITWIAAGHESDYLFITFVTMISTFVSAFLMWREISRISIWHYI